MRRGSAPRVAALGALVCGLLSLGAAPAPPPVDTSRLQDPAPAPTLASYRLFTDTGARIPNAGLTPYALNTPLFSDYAEKQRYLFMPPGEHARYRPTGVLDLPVGAVLVKTFAYPADFRAPTEKVRFIETRLLIHRADGWVPLTYIWNDAQTEAVLKRAGARTEVAFTDAKGAAMRFSYAVPNVNQCKECHQFGDALTPIGPKARNLNGDYAYGGGIENQLAHWTRLGLLQGAPAPSSAPATPRWDDPNAPVQGRALAYLDANCAQCHNPLGAASNSGLYLEYERAASVARGLGKRPVAAGKASANLDFDIAPGEPDQSILIHRMESREPGVMMPELGRSLVHSEGVDLVRAYIRQLQKTGG
jgi:uncharacterized repeat protein (TIGR03806 family)